MLLKPNQTIYSGTMPSDLVLTGNSNPIVKWESSTDSNFTNPVDINYYSSTSVLLYRPLYSTTYYRVVVLIDGVNVYSNTIKINVIDSPSADMELQVLCFIYKKLVTLLILGLQHTMNLSAQMLVTLLDLSIHLYCIHQIQ
jgi:hypothetical protein